MQSDEYFLYRDWEKELKSTYDNFNLVVVPPPKNSPVFFYQKANFMRRIPQGIFPHPNAKREILQPKNNKFLQTLIDQGNHDDFLRMEKEPMKMMVIQELKKQE